jgi:L-lactate dehydrogenase complex protein LldE
MIPAHTPLPRPSDVYFFATCVVDQFFPGAGMDAITLLERQGIRVHFPEEQTCCGQPAYTSGFPDEARKVAAHQLTCSRTTGRWSCLPVPAPA